MSITRLQQARQMYAMGQRVGRIAFGGGGSYSSKSSGYQGGSGAPGSAESKGSSKSTSTGGSTGNLGGGGGEILFTDTHIQMLLLVVTTMCQVGKKITQFGIY